MVIATHSTTTNIPRRAATAGNRVYARRRNAYQNRYKIFHTMQGTMQVTILPPLRINLGVTTQHLRIIPDIILQNIQHLCIIPDITLQNIQPMPIVITALQITLQDQMLGKLPL